MSVCVLVCVLVCVFVRACVRARVSGWVAWAYCNLGMVSLHFMLPGEGWGAAANGPDGDREVRVTGDAKLKSELPPLVGEAWVGV